MKSVPMTERMASGLVTDGYRPDVDGLRGIAIALVCLFHAGAGTFSGGYVGVDVFFVISGFVITRVLVKDLEAGRFSVADFFIRRVRRLAPALLLMLAFAGCVFTLLYPPDYLRAFGESLVWQSAFASNVHFWLSANYFGAPPDSKPLLHTWSLAVEEQFYFVFALALLMFCRSRRRTQFAMFGLALLVSLALSAWATARHPSASFYLLPTRAWELLAGVCIALAFSAGWLRARLGVAAANLLALAGIAAILVAALRFEPGDAFPGVLATIPVLGTAALIWLHAGHRTVVSGVLTLGPVVALGRVSYSLYLWHWISLTIAHWLSFGPPGAAACWAAIAAALAAAVFSWRWVEQPIRQRRVLAGNRALLTFAFLATASTAAFGVILVRTEGLAAQRGVNALEANPPTRNDREPECFDTKSTEGFRFCEVGARGAAPSFLAIGDSHALSLLSAVEMAAQRHGSAGLFGATDGCLPFSGILPARDAASAARCARMNAEALGIVRDRGIKHVILIARWSYYTDVGPDGMFQPVYSDAHHRPSVAESRQAFAQQYKRTLAAYRQVGAWVSVVLQVPHQRAAPNDFVFRKTLPRWLGGIDASRAGTIDVADHLAAQAFVRGIFRQSPPDTTVEPASVLCPVTGDCVMFAGGDWLYFDDDHLSVRGAALVSRTLDPLFEFHRNQP